jgi:short subunit dehydrogenase-like uncharacterized protein
LKIVVKGRFEGGEPYEATAVFIAEAALSIIFDKRASIGGCLTPSVALGTQYVERLKTAGFNIVLDSVEPK